MNTEALAELQTSHYQISEVVFYLNKFWNRVIFTAYLVLIPFACYCIYEAIFKSREAVVKTIVLFFGFEAVLILSLISFSAASIASEAHQLQSTLYTLSLNNLATSVRMQLATFLQRVNGPLIGLSCLDLFTITNGKISSLFTAVVSYFMIIIDFSEKQN